MKHLSAHSGIEVGGIQRYYFFVPPFNRLVGDVLLLTGFLSYSGPFNQEFRSVQQKNWSNEIVSRGIPVTDHVSVNAMLVDNTTVSGTGTEGFLRFCCVEILLIPVSFQLFFDPVVHQTHQH